MAYTCVNNMGLLIQAQSYQFNSYSMFKAALKEYTLVYILEYGKSRPSYYSAFTFSHNVFYPIMYRNHYFEKHLICRLQMLSILSSVKFCRLVKGYRKIKAC